jgi:hypothetical protein
MQPIADRYHITRAVVLFAVFQQASVVMMEFSHNAIAAYSLVVNPRHLDTPE